ncbi:FixH family protein [Xanthovirga aplysinae]|uniref:FixH family protein n=1 Tax=Xanthovirga aplysinae TaxID=2529853 RepID=UPI0012BC465D|nr:FixH family protein [Xanthovirga aplysinae]MTI31566.1 hypothetical protein [Xanthovirga aplysinae]
MNWGKSVALAFVLFAIMIIGLVVVCVKQDVNLVAEDYYKQEIAYQDRIDEIQNAKQMETKIQFVLNKKEHMANLVFPKEAGQEDLHGEIHFFRPSDASMDRKVVLALDLNGQQQIDISKLFPGYWKMQLSWTANGKRFFEEKSFMY